LFEFPSIDRFDILNDRTGSPPHLKEEFANKESENKPLPESSSVRLPAKRGGERDKKGKHKVM